MYIDPYVKLSISEKPDYICDFSKRIERWVIDDEAENGKGESIIKVVIIDTSCESSWRKIYPIYQSIIIIGS